MSSDEEIIAAAIDFVKAELSGNDASHDWQHIERVWTLAKRIHKDEGGEADGTVVQIGALLHDIREKKYGYSENAGAEAAVEFLTAKSFAPERIDKVVHVIKNISYRSEITGNTTRSPELDIVQDADRLDAVGAIGIARCFSYGGFKKRPLYTSSICMTEADVDQHETSIYHFHEKLFKLKNMMKTASGKKLAEARHDFMVSYIRQIELEVQGEL